MPLASGQSTGSGAGAQEGHRCATAVTARVCLARCRAPAPCALGKDHVKGHARGPRPVTLQTPAGEAAPSGSLPHSHRRVRRSGAHPLLQAADIQGAPRTGAGDTAVEGPPDPCPQGAQFHKGSFSAGGSQAQGR